MTEAHLAEALNDLTDEQRADAHYGTHAEINAGMAAPLTPVEVMLALRHDLDPAWCDMIADVEHDPDHVDRLHVEFIDGSTATITVDHTPA